MYKAIIEARKELEQEIEKYKFKNIEKNRRQQRKIELLLKIKNFKLKIIVMIPTKMFFTKGVGVAKEKLMSLEMAFRNAGIEKFNLVTVSSILPPGCQRITKEKGLKC